MALRLDGFVAIPPGAEAGFDHADCYRGERVYVAHTGADRIDVLDAVERRYTRSLDGLPGVAGVLIDEPADLLFSSDRGCARVSIWCCSDEQLLGQVAVGAHPNGLAYDPDRRRLHVFNLGDPPGRDPSVSLIDVDDQRVIATLPLPGVPDVVWHDPTRQVLYVAVGDPGSVSVFDTADLRLVETIPTEPGAHTTGWDQRARTLYVFEPESMRAAVYVDE